MNSTVPLLLNHTAASTSTSFFFSSSLFPSSITFFFCWSLFFFCVLFSFPSGLLTICTLLLILSISLFIINGQKNGQSLRNQKFKRTETKVREKSGIRRGIYGFTNPRCRSFGRRA